MAAPDSTPHVSARIYDPNSEEEAVHYDAPLGEVLRFARSWAADVAEKQGLPGTRSSSRKVSETNYTFHFGGNGEPLAAVELLLASERAALNQAEAAARRVARELSCYEDGGDAEASFDHVWVYAGRAYPDRAFRARLPLGQLVLAHRRGGLESFVRRRLRALFAEA